jgi:DNA-binding transcriptional ArsR family regulator
MSVIPESVLEDAARRFSLLGDPTRLRLVRHLHDHGESSVGDLAAAIGASLPNASQQLNRLLIGGILKRRRDGRAVLYSIADPTIEALCSIVCDQIRATVGILPSEGGA